MQSSDNPAKAKSLGALDSQVSASLDVIQTQLAAQFAPKLTFEDAISVLKKRIVDLEWKMMRRKAEVCDGLDCPEMPLKVPIRKGVVYVGTRQLSNARACTVTAISTRIPGSERWTNIVNSTKDWLPLITQYFSRTSTLLLTNCLLDLDPLYLPVCLFSHVGSQ